jgi:putative membrane protein
VIGLVFARRIDMQKLISLILVAALLACNRGDDDVPDARSPATGAPGDSGAAAPQPVYPEPEALQVLRVVDSARINSARAVREISQSEAILEYARVMIVDHRAIGALLDSTLAARQQSPADNAVSTELRNANQQFIAELLARDSGVNNAYIIQEINDHERVLQLLDSAVIPSARSPETRTLLERLRPAFDAHLQRARVILAARRAAAERATEPSARPPVDTARIPPITTTSM